jgi:hypothetical protein
MKTWRVIGEYEGDGHIDLICDHCGQDAQCPTRGRAPVIAVIGLRLILDPPNAPVPDDYLPESIQCRRCATIYEAEPVVR